MKKVLLTAWATACTLWASIASTCLARASEQTNAVTENAEKVLLTMDVLQTVCLVIVITAVVLFLLFYIAKAVLKRLHDAPEDKE